MGTPTPIYDIPAQHPVDAEAQRIARETITLDDLRASLENSTTIAAVAGKASSHTKEEGVREEKTGGYNSRSSFECSDYTDRTTYYDFFGNVENYSFTGLATDFFRLQSVTVRSGQVKYEKTTEHVYCEDTSEEGNASQHSSDCECSSVRPGLSITLFSYSSEPEDESKSYEVGTTTFNFLAKDRIGKWRAGSVTVNGDRNEIDDGIEFYVQTPLFRRQAIGLGAAVRSIRTLLGLSNDRLADFSEN